MVSARGISELYVDIMLTLIVLSISGAFIAQFNNLSNYIEGGGPVEMGKPPLALIIRLRSKSYLLIVNYEESPKEVTLIRDGVRVGNCSVGPEGFAVLEVDGVEDHNTYVLIGNYLVRPNYVDMR